MIQKMQEVVFADVGLGDVILLYPVRANFTTPAKVLFLTLILFLLLSRYLHSCHFISLSYETILHCVCSSFLARGNFL